MPEIPTKVCYKKITDDSIAITIILFPDILTMAWLRIRSIWALKDLATTKIFRGALVITCNKTYPNYTEYKEVLDKLLLGTKHKPYAIIDVAEISDRIRNTKHKTNKIQSTTTSQSATSPKDKRIRSLRLDRELIFNATNPLFPSLDSPSTTTHETSP